MSLIELVNNERTDKNTTHSYLELYEKLLNKKKYTAKNVLEIGISAGGSIKLWHDYFVNANVYGIDIIKDSNVWSEIKNKENIHLYTSTDAYKDEFVKKITDMNIKFDMILDDGPHTLESMIFFVSKYSKLLTEDGILILEDIQDYKWIEHIKNAIPDELKCYTHIHDLRKNKNRYDDLILIIDKKL